MNNHSASTKASMLSPCSNAIYSGTIFHSRKAEAKHSFRYRVYMLWLRVSEVDKQSSFVWPLISRRKFAISSVRSEDYMAHRGEQTLEKRISEEIKDKTGFDWKGDAFVLAHGRHLGFVMNPLSLYYCFDPEQKLQFVVGEITNTPWNERYCYVFDMRNLLEAEVKTFSFPKSFHVSPFLPMEMDYVWSLNTPGQILNLSIWNKVAGETHFEAHLGLKRHELTRLGLLKNICLIPLITFKVLFGIYYHAAILFLVKKVTFFSHPKSKGGSTT